MLLVAVFIAMALGWVEVGRGDGQKQQQQKNLMFQ